MLSMPSQNLGFVDSKATLLDITIGDREFSIRQSPTILSSNRGGGTTGAVVWKITPLFSRWLSKSTNLLFKLGIFNSDSTVLELGCGISGITGLSLSPRIGSYVLTDQDYVMKLLNQNLAQNRSQTSSFKKSRKSSTKPKGSALPDLVQAPGSITAKTLDWEIDEVTPSLTGDMSKRSFDGVIACDCIYNDTLIKPLVDICIDVCKLRKSDSSNRENPSICLVAQQLRASEVFEGWLKEFHRAFRVWRLPDEELGDGLKSDSGFVIHIGILR
ncbi:putative Diaminohydroxyphosphoribosylamino-pyrimidine deaminase [Diplocarpon rosae]|nr:putative Diaminohydroxyphosphoribosylamino-pyrimidine deaminase [Diplocarpon rosae]